MAREQIMILQLTLLNSFPIAIQNAKILLQPLMTQSNGRNTQLLSKHLEEAILGVVSSIDKPLSPVGEAKNDFNFNLEDISIAERLAIRQKIY